MFSVQGFFEDGVAGEIRQGKNVADAAKAANVQHFVYTSVGGAERNTGIPHFESKWAIEQHIRQLELPATIFRPVEFMENFNWGRPHILNGSLMSQGLRASRIKQFIAVDDIGAFAALAFGNSQDYVGKVFELAGDGQTESQLAETFSAVIGRPVQLIHLPPAVLESTLPPHIREEILMMWRWFDEEGYYADIAALRTLYSPLKTLKTWLQETGWENAEPVLEN